jgi:hypothetical protein
MSTRSTIAHTENWALNEEMISETTELTLIGERAEFIATQDSIKVTLPPDVIEAIVKYHGLKQFPHQREKQPEPL